MDTDSNQVFKFTLANLKSKPVIISAVVIVVVAAVVGFWYWHNKKLVITSPAPTTPATTDKSIGSQVFEKANNPIKDKVPETNPFKTQTNPFTKTETNPFQNETNPLKAQYKNPFQ